MINNYETIKNLLSFPNENSFYFLEVIKRRKENPDMKRHAEVIKDFYVTSLDGFESQFNKVKGYCDFFNARAYFRLNLRDARKVGLQCNKRLADILITEDWKALKNMYSSVVGEFHSDPDKKWIVDLDEEQAEPEFYTKVINEILSLNPNAVVSVLPTLNGIHIISRPFRLDLFSYLFPNVDIHKDNPTLLYAP